MKKIIVLFLALYNGEGISQLTMEWVNDTIPYISLADMGTDLNDNLIVTGDIEDLTNSSQDFFVISLSQQGSVLWKTQFGDESDEEPLALSVSSSTSDIFVSGRGLDKGLSIKLNSSGDFIWELRGEGEHYDNAAYANQELLIAPRLEADYLRIKADGVIKDTCVHSTNSQKVADLILVDSASNIFVGGTGLIDLNPVWFVEKLDSNCNQIWETYFQKDSFTNFNSAPVCLRTDSWGNIYIGGTAYINDEEHFFAAKLDPEGSLSWMKYYHTETDQVNSIDVDAWGNTFLTGYSYDGLNAGCLTLMYNTDGDLLWSDKTSKIALPTLQRIRVSDSLIYVLSAIDDSITGFNFLLRQLDYDGHVKWSDSYEGWPYLLWTKGQNVYVAGKNNDWDRCIVIKYNLVSSNRDPLNTSDLRIFPNPFHQSAFIILPEVTIASTLEWYDLPGRIIRSEKVTGTKNHTIYRSNLSNGIYIIKLIDSGLIIGTAKIIIQ